MGGKGRRVRERFREDRQFSNSVAKGGGELRVGGGPGTSEGPQTHFSVQPRFFWEL